MTHESRQRHTSQKSITLNGNSESWVGRAARAMIECEESNTRQPYHIYVCGERLRELVLLRRCPTAGSSRKRNGSSDRSTIVSAIKRDSNCTHVVVQSAPARFAALALIFWFGT